MSWHYLQGQEAASWEADCLDGAPSALSRLIPMRAKSCLLDRLTDALTDSQSGTTCEPSTEYDGAGRSMSSAEDFRVRTSAQQDEVLGEHRVTGAARRGRQLAELPPERRV